MGNKIVKHKNKEIVGLNEKFVTREIIIEKLKDIFADHIGKSNPISTESLFIQITGLNPEILNWYEKETKWSAIKRGLASLRQSGELFVIMGVYHHYVLDSKEELTAYEHKVDATILGMKRMKKKAGTWVGSKTLKQMKKKSKKKIAKKKVAMIQ